MKIEHKTLNAYEWHACGPTDYIVTTVTEMGYVPEGPPPTLNVTLPTNRGHTA